MAWGGAAAHAKRQYVTTRDPRELLFQFKKRALVHFAVDSDEVWMTTRLDGERTRYLPFNQGFGKGAGNPPNPTGYKTAYLWEQIWAKDSWLEIIGRFVHLQKEEVKLGGKSVKKESLIFPRYHQLDAVRQLTTKAKEMGPGHNYLIQHSVGSGKSNSIAWLAYRLSSLYDDADQRIFDSVIVVTDRRVLDQQLQDTIYQFEHVSGVLQNYTTYKTYFRLSKAIEDDPKMNKKKAARAIARFVSLHPHNLDQKTEIIIEHFRQCVMHKIGGKAKAMVVTASRPHVVRYKQHFDDYLKEHNYHDIRALVAFTAFKDKETGLDYTEAEINGFGERELLDKFAGEEYNLLLVAEKYQTGFDQPLLHTMYVDKKLSGVQAVQTLSRLNRTCPGKEDTFVLDFANSEEEIVESFQPFYEKTTLTATTDPNKLYDLKTQLDEYQIIRPAEVDAFTRVFFKPQRMGSKRDHGLLNSFIDPAVDRYRHLEDEEKQDDFKNTLTVFVWLYAFLAQIMPFADVELEKLYVYNRLLLTKLPKQNQGERLKLEDEVALEYYRLQKIKEGSISLQKNGDAPLDPVSEAGTRREKEERAKLSEIIEVLNDRFGTEFVAADKLFFDQVEEELAANETLSQQAKSNTIENFRYGFEEEFLNALIGRMDQNQEIFAKILDDAEFGDTVREWMLKKVYQRLNEDVDVELG